MRAGHAEPGHLQPPHADSAGLPGGSVRRGEHKALPMQCVLDAGAQHADGRDVSQIIHDS